MQYHLIVVRSSDTLSLTGDVVKPFVIIITVVVIIIHHRHHHQSITFVVPYYHNWDVT